MTTTSAPASLHDADAAASAASSASHLVREIFRRYGLVVLLVGVVLYFSLAPASSALFLSVPNIRNILGSQSVVIVIGIAAILPHISGRFDFSVGANAGMSSLVCAYIMSAGGGLIEAIAACLAVGVVIGAINGVLVAYARLSSVVVTLAMGTVISGIVLALANGQLIKTGIARALLDLGTASWVRIPIVVLFPAAPCVVCWW